MPAYCDRCDRSFPDYRALQQHREASGFHWFCHNCRIDFPCYDERREHYIQSPNHHYCRACDEHFNSETSKKLHLFSQHWYCGVHEVGFQYERHLQEHYKQSPDHHYCTFCCKCNRAFQSQNNLQQHLNSKLHKPSNIMCPGRGCNMSFISVAALTLHFESGTCPSGMTREELDRRVVRADRNNYITNPDRLISGPGGYEAPSTTLWATERSWNGEVSAYECFVCHSMFTTLAGLNQHLKSPVHREKIYRCPKQDCLIEFKTLSALCQHVEGGSCGLRVFKQVQDVMDRLTMGFNMLTFN
ncbi:hypothetical protein V8E53_010058 [Lactarius tabidus]